MAECADLSRSIQGGSDADFEIFCTPCSDDGRKTEGSKYCPQCKEYLCTTCTRCHTRFAATRDHQLTDSVKHNSSGVRNRTKGIPNASCSLHPDREIEMFCGSHDMVYCALCIAKDHRLCDNVSEVAEAATCRTLAQSPIGDKISRLRDELVTTKEEKIGSLQTLGAEKNEHLKKVKRTSRKIISHIEKLTDEASTSIERKYEKNEQELQADTITITEAIEKLDKSREQINSLKNLNQTHQFVQEKLQKNMLADIEKLSISTKQKKTRAIHYTANEKLIEQVMTAAFLATTKEREKSERNPKKEPLKIKSKKEVNVKEKDDKRKCAIIGICQLPDGTIILADENNKKLKRLDNDYKVKDHCDLRSMPSGVCCSGESEVAVKVGGGKDGKIQFVHVGATLSQVRSFDIEGGGYYGLSFFVGKLWVGTGNCINIYNVSGTKVMSIENNIISKEISPKSPDLLLPAGADTTSLYISDTNEIVASVNGYRKVTKVFSDERLQNVRTVSCYPDGTLFLAGYSSNNITMFSNDGKCLGELIRAKDNLGSIQGMCFDKKHKHLLVGCYSDNLHVIQLDD
ncbi:tripartite motif-containing protein 45-like [Mercenaria mercenaria]|uniref:tripartite motif-containing protein 45-like n=1 Tax=Mercenaria mercenaria TaxID=6596 RepID=UPI00234F4FCE|nr:tripartite motif-containing protein 45-like [Mercenaria mercenaria]